MLKSINKNNEESYLSYELNEEQINNIREKELICPACKEKVIFVNTIQKIKHFRHERESLCDFEPEGPEHLAMKKYFIDKLNLTKDNIEVYLGFARPDLLIESNGKRIAIEVQHSKLSYDKFIERTENYTKNNIYVLWVFDENNIELKIYDNIIFGILLNKVTKKAHEIYFGSIYFFYNNELWVKYNMELKCEFINNCKNYKKFPVCELKKNKFEKINKLNFNTSFNNWKDNNYLISNLIFLKEIRIKEDTTNCFWEYIDLDKKWIEKCLEDEKKYV